MTFRRRLALFLIATLIGVQVLSAGLGYVFLRHTLVEKGKRELTTEAGVFTRQLNVLSERATEGVEVLSLDYALRQAIAQRDYDTELSALRNHGHRIGATRMLLVGLDGKITADTGAPFSQSGAFLYSSLLSDAAVNNRATALATLDGRVYWIVAVPVLAPVPIAFIAACIPVDNTLLDKLRTMSVEQRSIALATHGGDGLWKVVAKTNDYVDVILPRHNAVEANVVTTQNREFLTVTAPLKTAQHSAPVFVILDYPLDEALAPYLAIAKPILLVLAGALVLALIGSMLIVRTFSQPLEQLAAAARRIAGGDYTRPERLKQRDELGHLSDALINMTGSIAEREAALTSAIGSLEVARNEAVKANEAKSHFLANMSHELRTPLNAIVGFGEMLHQEVLGPIGVKRYGEYAADIVKSGQHLLSLVAKMLDLADFEAGRMEISRRPVTLVTIVRNSATLLKPMVEKGGIELHVADDLAAMPEFAGDAAKLGSAVHGVLHNAVKFTPKGGRVSVTASRARDGVRLAVEDTGVGMQPEDIEVVVRPFHRLRSALDGQHQGTGLGLPFAKAIVEQHGGTLTIYSMPGEGTRVEIVLPLAATALSDAA
ncbi:MAG TPA: ATP-binding protein [Rhizomicrobium sp.]|nr:ATP-binding protein [Rhizomicrobium sp.]